MAFKVYFLIIFMAFLGLQACKQVPTDAVDFLPLSWSQTLAKAKAENKIIFFDAYAAWCRPCRKMQEDTFTDSTLAAYFNQHFINVKFDMEKGEGIDLATQYQITAYPTLLFLDPNGKELQRVRGKRDAAPFLQIAQQVKKSSQ